MYIPKYLKVTNVDEIWDFVQKLFWNNRHNKKEKPIATHLPFGLTKKVMTILLPDIWLMGTPSGEHLKPVRMFL